jgi:protein translocase SecG subunit
MKTFLLVTQLFTALSLVGLILLQTSKGGLQSGMGGEAYRTKRGAEKIFFLVTIGMGIAFFVISIVNLLFP